MAEPNDNDDSENASEAGEIVNDDGEFMLTLDEREDNE